MTRLILTLFLALSFTHPVFAAPDPAAAGERQIRIVLVGDSTVTDSAGWGIGFKQCLTGGAKCANTAQGGRSSRSFRDEGHWTKALALKGDYYLIQFGHNNQPGKPGRSTDMPTFISDMTAYVTEARAAGGKPVLVTPLTRRQWDKEHPGKIQSSLEPYAEEVRKIAAAHNVPLIDLHRRSIELCELLGAEKCLEFSPRKRGAGGKPEYDGTHLNDKGHMLFGHLVAGELRKCVPELAPMLREMKATKSGVFDAVVSGDGTGDFTTIQEAINKAPQTATAERPWTIRVNPGIYRELVQIQREKRFVRLVGEDPDKTVISYNLHASMKGPDGLELGTFRTPTVLIDADDFAVENLTLENSAGPVGQALAIRVDGDRVAFRNCTFRGYQDTILLNRGRQYFQNCTITGAVDFIFGGATAFFDRCTLDCIGNGYITAASTPAEAAYGFVFAHCTIRIGKSGSLVYLGRPWRDHASTIFIGTHMPKGIRPEGWHNWDKPERERTARYSEVNSTGEGANPSRRVSWARPMNEQDAGELTAPKVLGGWNP